MLLQKYYRYQQRRKYVLTFKEQFVKMKNINTNNLEQLSLFSVVQFPNLECSTGDTTTPFGTCLTSSECTSKGGVSSLTCAAGFGVCCTPITSTCGSTISANSSYIRNPGYPSTYTPPNAGTCTYTINKANDDVRIPLHLSHYQGGQLIEYLNISLNIEFFPCF